MKKLIVILMLFVFIGAVDLLITYKNSSSVFGYMERYKDDDEASETSKVQDYERPERDPKLADTLSDFTNKIDCEEYFANKKGMYYPQSNEYLVSHNVFVNSDRSKVTVDITSRYYKKDGVYSGEMRCYIQNSEHGSVSYPCAYDSESGSGLKYTYNDNFSLLLDDYNNDGNPDYLIRTGDPEDGGAFYYIEYSVNEAYPVHHTNFSTPKTNSDSAVFIYGRSLDSIRLDHTDMDHFFFLTKEDDGAIVPYIYNSDFRQCDYSDYAVGNRLYSAFYENGVLTLRATDCSTDMENYEDEMSVTVRKLDGQIWSRCGEFSASFSERDYCRFVHFFEYEQSFEKGLYQLEIKTPDGSAYAEFAVRK